MNSYRVLLRQMLAVMLFMFSLGAVAQNVAVDTADAVNSPGQPFNHLTTGFVLLGAHVTTQCESCHTQGQFKGTPRDCASCHRTGGRASGKPVVHIPSQEACDTCHRTTAWMPASFKHTAQMSGQCASCHSGNFAALGALAKPLTHINTTSSCNTCHATAAWLPATNPHAGVQPGSCAGCHNGTRAIGKNTTHIPVSGSCDTCHNNFNSFAPAVMDHTGQTACSSCHSGAFASKNAQGKPTTHIPTSDQCTNCHTSTTTWSGGLNFAHPSTAPNRCLSCHNGSVPAAKAKPVNHLPATGQCDSCHTAGYSSFVGARVNHATVSGQCATCHDGNVSHVAQNARGKSGTHISTLLSCDTCHVTAAWAPASNFAHQGVSAGSCVSCHNGSAATGKPAGLGHIPGDGACDNCHKNYVAFSPARMNHTGLAVPCSSCHNPAGSFVGVNAQTRASSSTHNPSNSECNSCHSSTVSWATVTYVHTAADVVCSTCHNGTNALGKPARHITTSGQCSDCHVNKVSFTPAQMVHSTSTLGNCLSCHDGSFKFANAQAKPASHIPVAGLGQCDDCHSQNAASFAPAKMNHSGQTACSSCHGGLFTSVNAQTKPISHTATTDECATCHTSTSVWASGVSYRHPSNAVSNCISCHSGTVRGALSKPTTHIPTAVGQQCDSCHTNYQAFRPAQMNHANVGRCDSCHNGSFNFANALPKRAGHVPTSADCVTCHTGGYSTWVGARMKHDAAVVGKCSTCHSGGFQAVNAQPKSPTHIPTTAQCDSCHKSTSTWATGTFAHTSAVAGQCSTCHNSRNAIGKPTNHIPTAAQCDTCHKSFAGFRPASMDHTGLSAQCSSCHNGSYLYVNALAKPSSHIPTQAQCDTCHTNGFVTWVPAAMSHAGYANNCSTCHSGTYLAQNAQTKPSTHIPTTAQCDSCHRSTTSWAGTTYSHDATATGHCSSCHDGQVALGKSTRHIPVTAQCDTCHSNFGAFAPARMDHVNGMGGQACATCHNGSYPTALAKPTTHIATYLGCDSCHTTAVWKPASGYVHANPGPACASCHNGVNALGRSTRHIPTATACNVCHSNSGAAPSFTPATMVHTNETLCSNCHNGNYQAQNAQSKPTTHVSYSPADKSCADCHTSRTSWATGLAPLNHASLNPVAAGRCAACHTGGVLASATVIPSLSKPTNHLPTTAQCDTCHLNTTAFAPATMNHAATAGKCSSCHNGSFLFANAQTKSIRHVATTAQCDTCHKSTSGWSAAQYVHDANATGRCDTCHAGSTPVGLIKPASHIPTAGSANCDSCHSNFSSFAPARMNHSGLTTRCDSCHNGAYVAVNAQKVTTGHIPVTGIDCVSCHANGFSSWTPSVMNHTVLSARCDSCHSNGTYAAQNAQSRSANHVPITPAGSDCSVCHGSVVSWAITGKPQNHASNVNNCSTCHTNLANSPAIGKPNTHIPTSLQCDTCHSTNLFVPAQTNHSGTVGKCLSCHNGSFAGVGAKGKTATHITTALVCDTCHTTVAWKPASNFAHQGVTAGSCANCHNGTNALGKPTRHIPVAGACDSCHKNYVAFAPAQMSHTGLNGQCSTCHSGAYLTINAQTKPTTHLTTTAQCDTCHSSTSTWATATFVHAVTDTLCSSCHNGTKALGKPVNHIPTTDQCSICHTNKFSFKPAQMTHAAPATNIAGNCSTCHNGNYVFANALAKPSTHIPVSGQCSTCHTDYLRWSPSQMSHTGLTACTTCHSGAYLGQNAQMKPAGHILTALNCDSANCHASAATTKSWATNSKPDHNLVTGTCLSCHDGGPLHAIGKPSNHVPSDSNCELCHSKSAPNFSLTVMSHATAAVGTGKCATCHIASYAFTGAQAKTTNHIATTQSCDVCHKYPAWTPTSFNHVGVSATCTTCHNGVNAATKTAGHIPTGAQCSACHNTGANGLTWMPLKTPRFDHAGTTGICATCHVRPYAGIKAMEDTTHIPVTLGGMLGKECSLCHTGYTTFMGARMNHGNVTVCKNCHDRAAPAYDAPGIEKKSVTHESKTGTDCNNANCHKPGLKGQGTLYTSW